MSFINEYPLDKKGVKRTQGHEFYITDIHNNEKYITDKYNYQIYAFEFLKKREKYARNKDGFEYYAERSGNEVYAVDLRKGFQKFIMQNLKQIYAVDKYNNQKYPYNLYRKEKLARDENSVYYYAKLANLDEFYPKDDLRNEYPYKNIKNEYLIAVTSEGKPKAPMLKNGKINYMLDKDGKQILYEHEGNLFFGNDLSGNNVYPLDEKGDEYYPIINNRHYVAEDNTKTVKYALDSSKQIIYPETKTYLSSANGDESVILQKQAKYFKEYLDDKYPIKKTKFGETEILINNVYTNMYPIDSKFNEYTNKNGDFISDLDYPITNDSYIILPNVNNKPRVQPGDEHLLKTIKFLLYRPEFDTYDFLTNTKSTRIFFGTLGAPIKYKVLDLSKYKTEYSQFNTNYYIIGGLISMICFLLICICIYFLK